MLSGYPGRSGDEGLLLTGAGSAEPVPHDGAGRGLGDGDVRLVRRERDAVREREAVDEDADLAVRTHPQEPPGPRHLHHLGLPGVDPVNGRGVRHVHRAVRRDGGVVAELHGSSVDLGDEDLDAAGPRVDGEQAAAGVADEEPPVAEQLDPERTTAGVGDPLDAASVVAQPVDAAVRGAGEDTALVGPVERDDDVLRARRADPEHLERHAAILSGCRGAGKAPHEHPERAHVPNALLGRPPPCPRGVGEAVGRQVAMSTKRE